MKDLELLNKLKIMKDLELLMRIAEKSLVMRESQKAYFKHRTKELLISSKCLEQSLDDLLSDWLDSLEIEGESNAAAEQLGSDGKTDSEILEQRSTTRIAHL